MMRKMIAFFAIAFVAMLAVGFLCKPAHAAGAPAFSVKRLSIGAGADYVTYRPSVLGERHEFRGVIPVSYNLGNYVSLTGRFTYGVTSHEKEYGGGITLHLLARGERP